MPGFLLPRLPTPRTVAQEIAGTLAASEALGHAGGQPSAPARFHSAAKAAHGGELGLPGASNPRSAADGPGTKAADRLELARRGAHTTEADAGLPYRLGFGSIYCSSIWQCKGAINHFFRKSKLKQNTTVLTSSA